MQKSFSTLKLRKYYPMLSYGISVAVLTVLLIFYMPEVCFAIRSQSDTTLFFKWPTDFGEVSVNIMENECMVGTKL